MTPELNTINEISIVNTTRNQSFILNTTNISKVDDYDDNRMNVIV